MRAAAVVFCCLAVGLFGVTQAQLGCAELNHCSGQGVCVGGACVCYEGFAGPTCDSSTTNCKNSCSGRGACLDGVCDCDAGYSGEDCGSVSSACAHVYNCTGHGVCVDGACVCAAGWSGDACDQSATENLCPAELHNCTDHGTCGPAHPDALVFTCQCDIGFCGDKCNVACPTCMNNCSGHGVCTHGSCACQAGFSGTDCSIVVPVAGCPNYCSGRGVCQDNACRCNDGWSGNDCSAISPTQELCPDNCNNRGSCEAGVCSCNLGFTGSACQDLVLCASNCSGQGACDNGKRKCYAGFSGDECQYACDSGSSDIGCSAEGTCVLKNNEPQCICSEWRVGRACELEDPDNDGIAGIAGEGSPIAIALLCLLGALVVIMLGGYTYNYAQGKRGVQAIPGYSSMSKATDDDAGYNAIK